VGIEWRLPVIAGLFQKDVRTVNEHIQNIFEEGELSPNSVIRNFRITAADGKTYDTQHYNLDVISAVGYRLKSHRGTQFRQWARASANHHDFVVQNRGEFKMGPTVLYRGFRRTF
jgi:hypothetical protein